jgi:hypothetical protein
MLKNYKTQAEFLDAVSGALEGTAADPALRQAIVDGVREADTALGEEKDEGTPGLELRMGKWFMRNDDFPFFQLVGAVAVAVAGLGASGGITAPALVGPIVAFAAACWQVHRKGADLTPEQLNVLGVLSTHEGLTVEAIAAKLAAAKLIAGADGIPKTLKSLTRLELFDGSEVAIVRRDEKGRWRALRV